MSVLNRVQKLIGPLLPGEVPRDFDESITISLGVAAAEPTDESLDDVLKRADEAVYEAKNSGRNRVVVFGAETAP